MDKQCFKCKQTKDISEFYLHPKMGDGHLGKCKSCTRSDSDNRYKLKMQDPVWKEKEAKRQREKENRAYANGVRRQDREKVNAYRHEWISKNPEK